MENLPSCGECGSNEHVGVYDEEEEGEHVGSAFHWPPYETWWCSTCKHEIDCYGDRLSDDVLWSFCPSCGKDIHPKHSNEDGLFRCNEDSCPDGLFRHASNAENYRHQEQLYYAAYGLETGNLLPPIKRPRDSALRYVDHPDYEMTETLRKAHPGIGNWELVKQSTLVGCCYCLKIMSAESLNEETDVTGDMSIVCPNCRIDCVLCDASGFPVTIEFLTAMRDYWFA